MQYSSIGDGNKPLGEGTKDGSTRYLLGIALLFVLLFPIVVSLKADGSLVCSWAILWTPVWVLDGFMLALAAVNIFLADSITISEQVSSNVELLSSLMGLTQKENQDMTTKIVQLVKTVLVVIIQILVVFKLDASAESASWTGWSWGGIALPWIIYEIVTITSLLPIAFGHLGTFLSTLAVVPTFSATGSLEFGSILNLYANESMGDFKPDVEMVEPEEIKNAVVAIDAADITQKDSADSLELMLCLAKSQERNERYVRTQQSPLILVQMQSEERKFDEILTLRLSQNGILVCLLRLWLAISLSAKLDFDTSTGPNGPNGGSGGSGGSGGGGGIPEIGSLSSPSWTSVLYPVWIFVASQYLLALLLRAWTRAILSSAYYNPSLGGTESIELTRSKHSRGARLLGVATAIVLAVTVTLVLGLGAVLRLQLGLLRELSCLYIVLPSMLVLLLVAACVPRCCISGMFRRSPRESPSLPTSGVGARPLSRTMSTRENTQDQVHTSKELFFKVGSLTEKLTAKESNLRRGLSSSGKAAKYGTAEDV